MHSLTKYLMVIKGRDLLQNVLLLLLAKLGMCVTSFLVHLHGRSFSKPRVQCSAVQCSAVQCRFAVSVIALRSFISRAGLGIFISVRNERRQRATHILTYI
jgi:hypothetical protein